jgi:hypothetical protein
MTTMEFSPPSATVTIAWPVGTPALTRTPVTSMPSRSSRRR